MKEWTNIVLEDASRVCMNHSSIMVRIKCLVDWLKETFFEAKLMILLKIINWI